MGIHFTDGGLAGGAVALQPGVAEGLQIGRVVIVDIFPGIGRKDAMADGGVFRMSAGDSGAVNLNVMIVIFVICDVAVTIVLFLYNVVCVQMFAFSPGVAHDRC